VPTKQQARSKQVPQAPVLTFVEAAHEHDEPAFDVTVTPTAATQQLGPFDVPAFGFLRHIYLLVTTSGGTLGPGTITADFPYDLFTEVTLLDVNGGQIFGPMDGYSTYLANKYGAYAFRPDPSTAPDASIVGVITFTFGLRIPVEISGATALGALANQNAAAAYKVRLGINTIANIWAVAPTAAPAVRIRGILEAWTQPAAHDALGRGQAGAPPAHGTSQFWSILLRTIIVVVRTAGGARQGPALTNMPTVVDIRWDARQVTNEPHQYRRTLISERGIPGTVNVDDGVLVFDYTHSADGIRGYDDPTLWLPTVQATRFEIHAGDFTAGQLQIITNDVAPVEVNPADRYVETSQTGFHPAY
jgi:hypothetical protein